VWALLTIGARKHNIMYKNSRKSKNRTMSKYRSIFIVFCLIISAMHCFSEASDLKGVLKGFVFELPNQEGARAALVKGETATVLPGGFIEIDKVFTRIFCEDGREVFVTSDTALFDKNNGEVSTEVPVKIVSEGVVITGTGMLWRSNKQLIEIKENVKVECVFDKKDGQLWE